MRRIWIVACIGALGVANAGTIFRCAGGEGEVLFTDVACPDGRPQPTRDVNTVEWIGPGDGPSTPNASAGSRAARVEPKRAAASARSRVDAIDAAAHRCDVARDRLEALRATMRRGYKASSAGRLELRLHAARERVERDCND
jgi:hypothetical protein